MIYILAGNAEQARQFARSHNLTGAQDYRYVVNRDTFRGCMAPNIAIIGNFWERPDACEIWDALRVCMRDAWPAVVNRAATVEDPADYDYTKPIKVDVLEYEFDSVIDEMDKSDAGLPSIDDVLSEISLGFDPIENVLVNDLGNGMFSFSNVQPASACTIPNVLTSNVSIGYQVHGDSHGDSWTPIVPIPNVHGDTGISIPKPPQYVVTQEALNALKRDDEVPQPMTKEEDSKWGWLRGMWQ